MLVHGRLSTHLGAAQPSACLGTHSNGSHPQRRHVPRPVAAGVQTELTTAPLTKDDLVAYISSGCKPRSAWRIGTEHEKLGFHLGTHERMDYNTISKVFQRLQDRFGWRPIIEAGLTIGCELDGQSVTLEPGGQFELSGAPVSTVHKTCAEVNSHLYQVKTIGEELGIGFLGIGFDPQWALKDIPLMPKERYKLMRSYMPTVSKGTSGLDMMLRTCTVQVNLDYESEQDMVEKLRIGLALQPIAVALFANSPFVENKPTGQVSTRTLSWEQLDPARTGNLPFAFDANMSFERYVDYAMDVPMYFIYRNGKYINALGQSWRDFMKGKSPALPGELPTMDDWTNHLTTIFPDVRMKKFLEMRGADGGPFRMICALPALWVGLIYDSQAQTEALALIEDWTAAERDYLRYEVPRQGLRTPFRGGTVRDVARDVLAISRKGLVNRGSEEVHFLKQLDEVVETGLTPADRLLALYNGRWNKDVSPLWEELAY